MNSRDAQDVILRLLADGPFRTAAMTACDHLEPKVAGVISRIDLAGLDRFGRFLCRHYYRERVVHYFKYSRALTSLTDRAPEKVLKAPEFTALMPQLILGDRGSAESVWKLLRYHLTENADLIRARIPYWDDLVAYQGTFFVSDALSVGQGTRPYPARAETATILELSWDLPVVLPNLLRPFTQVPLPAQRPIRLLFARSQHGEVTVLRCTETLKNLLEGLTGEAPPAQVAARIGLEAGTLDKTLQQLEQLGAVLTRESFSSSHVGSDQPA